MGEILSPMAAWACNICQIYWRPQTRNFLEGTNVFGKGGCVFGVFSPKRAETFWEKTSPSKTGISRLLTSDISQCWLIFKCYAWFELHFFACFNFSFRFGGFFLCRLFLFNPPFAVTREKVAENVSIPSLPSPNIVKWQKVVCHVRLLPVLSHCRRMQTYKPCPAHTRVHSQPPSSLSLYMKWKCRSLGCRYFSFPSLCLSCFGRSWCDAMEVGSIAKAPALSRSLFQSQCLRAAE